MVFKALDLDSRSTADPSQLLEYHMAGKEGEEDMYVNDLEPPAFACIPELRTLKDRLGGLGFDVVSMSGSGTSLFCIGEPTNLSEGEAWPECITKEDGSFPFPVRVFKTKFIQREEGAWYRP